VSNRDAEATSADRTILLTESQLARPNAVRRRQGDPLLANAYDSFRDFQLSKNLKVELNYHLTRVLGRGTQGVVIATQRQAHHACVTQHALKIFDPSVYNDLEGYQNDLRRIGRQVGVLQRLSHPNLVGCNWLVERDNVGMLLMERVDGLGLNAFRNREQHASLQNQIAEDHWQHINSVVFADGNHVQPGIALYILRKILRGISVLHRVGYMHCDIKPSNVMLDRFGTIKLIDFGRAIPLENPDGLMIGSPLYMPPEVHRREALTAVGDLYSAGLVALELLHGDYLINPRNKESNLLEFKMELPNQIGDFLSPELRGNTVLMDTLKRLLAVEPRDRYASAADADTGTTGVRRIHRQLLRADLDTDYGRELESYMELRISGEGELS
jgi:eukaryotic-like serine/threonine-protein kinase